LFFKATKISFNLLYKCIFSRLNSPKRPLLHVIILGCIALITAFFISRLPLLGFDYDFEALFPNENEELKHYENYRNTFEYDNEFVLIAVEHPAGIFKKEFLLKIDSLHEKLSAIPNIKQVQCPTRLSKHNLGGLVPIKTQLLHVDDEMRYKEDSVSVYSDPDMVGAFFAEDAKSLCLFVKTDENLSKAESDALALKIEQAVSSFPSETVHYAGRIFAQKVYLEQLQREFLRFILLAFSFVMLLLWFSFRSAYGTLVPITVVLLSVIWTLGIMQVLGKSIDLMCSMLPTMIFVAGMSDVTHYFSAYTDERRKGTPDTLVFSKIRKEVAYPTFLTLLTTVIGFLSLLFSSIEPVRDFGIYTSLGVSVAYVLTYSFLPSVLQLYPPKKHLERSRLQSKGLNMQKGIHLVFRNQKKIVLFSILALIIAFIGINQLKINNTLLEDLSDRVKVKRDFTYFDEHYSGARPFELEIKIKNPSKSIWDYAQVKHIHQLDSFIKKEFEAGFVLSLANLIQRLDAQMTANPDYFPSEADYAELRTTLEKNKKNKTLLKLVSADGKATRISAKFKDIGSEKVNALNSKLITFIEANSMEKDLILTITGAAHLIDRNNAYMVENMLQGFAFSICLIALLTFFVHRSWKMVLVFLVPNLIPLIVVSGFMGFTGIELKSATALVFSIAFGIATDDTIHFISRLKIELQKGKTLLYAFKRTYLETGKPIVLTTFILMGGFVTLMLSNFQSIYYFGLLICITIFIALLADLFLLPVLLLYFFRKKGKP
jgi:uncharacterized protein